MKSKINMYGFMVLRARCYLPTYQYSPTKKLVSLWM